MQGLRIVTFLLIASTLTGVYYGQSQGASLDFPTLELPTVEFIDLSAGCAGFSDCTEYLANVFRNIGAGAIAGAQFTFEILSFTFALFGFLIEVVFLLVAGINQAPWYISGPIATILLVMVSLWLIKTVRGQET